MKKILSLFIIPFISLFFVTEVNAKEIYLDYQEDFSLIQEKLSSIGTEKVNYAINFLIDYYKVNLEKYYSHYIISVFPSDLYNLSFVITMFNEDATINNRLLFSSHPDQYDLPFSSSEHSSDVLAIHYDDLSSSFSDIVSFPWVIPMFTFSSDSSFIYPYNYYYSNFDFYYIGSYFPEITYFNYLSVDDTLYVPLFNNPTTYAVHRSTEDFLIEPYYLYDENSTLEPDSDIYTTIDLNNYSYVALSLKNYDVEAFNSIFYVNGQLCPTKVYGYGLTETVNTDRCNPAYTDFTPVRICTSDYDIKNHIIYYFKAYDTSIENKLKVNSSIFNIHYITEEEKDNPILDINGHKYSTIPFDNLSTNANKNETENFVPGASEETSFSDIFTAPLEFLKNIWNSISSVFSLITNFISLLPVELQSLLYTGFALALTLGIIKILL